MVVANLLLLTHVGYISDMAEWFEKYSASIAATGTMLLASWLLVHAKKLYADKEKYWTKLRRPLYVCYEILVFLLMAWYGLVAHSQQLEILQWFSAFLLIAVRILAIITIFAVDDSEYRLQQAMKFKEAAEDYATTPTGEELGKEFKALVNFFYTQLHNLTFIQRPFRGRRIGYLAISSLLMVWIFLYFALAR